MISGGLQVIVGVFARWWRMWLTWRTRTRAYREMHARCEQREQRLEDADVPPLLTDLHILVRAAFRSSAGVDRDEVEDLLERYVRLLIMRQGYAKLLRRSRPCHLAARRELAMTRRRPRSAQVLDRRLGLAHAYEATVRRLDRDAADLEALIRMLCERQIFMAAAA
jgi:hypothetical protein